MADFPSNLKYDQNYSWVQVDGEIATLGISKVGAEQVDEFVFVMLPEKGRQLARGDVYVNLEAVKWSGQLETPVSGEVVDVNMAVFDMPSKINQQPFSNWLVKIKMTNQAELADLLDAEAAASYYKKD